VRLSGLINPFLVGLTLDQSIDKLEEVVLGGVANLVKKRRKIRRLSSNVHQTAHEHSSGQQWVIGLDTGGHSVVSGFGIREIAFGRVV
jgi:hypothetical protein